MTTMVYMPRTYYLPKIRNHSLTIPRKRSYSWLCKTSESPVPVQSNPIQSWIPRPSPPPQELTQEIVKACANVAVDTVACTVPDGTLLAYHAGLPAYANSAPPAAVNTVGEDTEDAQTRFEFWTAQDPLLEVRVKPEEPEAEAVKVAHVPPMYQVPGLMMQPFDLPPEVTWRVPLPANGVPGAVVGVLPVVVVVVVPAPDLGRYLTPVAGQSELEPSGVEVSRVDMREDIKWGVPGLTGIKVPVCTLPWTS